MTDETWSDTHSSSFSVFILLLDSDLEVISAKTHNSQFQMSNLSLERFSESVCCEIVFFGGWSYLPPIGLQPLRSKRDEHFFKFSL